MLIGEAANSTHRPDRGSDPRSTITPPMRSLTKLQFKHICVMDRINDLRVKAWTLCVSDGSRKWQKWTENTCTGLHKPEIN